MEHTNCPKCNTENPKEAIFCNHCGATFSDIALQEELAHLSSTVSPLEELSPPHKSPKKLWIIAVTIAGLLVMTIVCFLSAANAASGEMKPAGEDLDTYMKHLEAKDIESAYALCSPSLQKNFSKSSMRDLVTGDSYQYIEGYQSLSITKLTVHYSSTQTADVSGELPQ